MKIGIFETDVQKLKFQTSHECVRNRFRLNQITRTRIKRIQ